MPKWRSEIELVEPNDLRVWMDGTREALADRGLSREHWRNYDSARRFERNPEMCRLQLDTWMTRADCYRFARQHVQSARIFLDGIGKPPCQHCVKNDIPQLDDTGLRLEALEYLTKAIRYRELARGKWPAFHDHPREQVQHYDHPIDDPEARAEALRELRKAKTAAAKAAKQRELELDIADFEPRQAAVSQYHLDKWAAEREARRVRREALAAKWEAESAPEPESARPLATGDSVILAGTAHGGWADSLPRRPWLVVECACHLCASGSHVTLDVPNAPELLALYPELGPWRHVGVGALRRRGELSRKQGEAWADALAMGCGVGQALHWADEKGRGAATKVAAAEFAAFALADVLGSTEITAEQKRQLDQWICQSGGVEIGE